MAYRNFNRSRPADFRMMSKVKVAVKCSECEKVEPAYKCPKCAVKYCSVECCKIHKDRCTEENAIGRTVADRGFKRRYTYAFPSADTVALDKLMEIKNDERVKSLLESAKLRALIRKLDETPNPKAGINEAMKDPEFRTFSNIILEVVGVGDEYEISCDLKDLLMKKF